TGRPYSPSGREFSNQFTKSGYPLGLRINSERERFVDEGMDMRDLTYAKFGRAILALPGHIVFQVWSRQVIPWLQDEEYRPEIFEHITAPSISELAEKCSR
ncbi:hypothetical protein McanCB21832_005773, partial [Microsporum canis]